MNIHLLRLMWKAKRKNALLVLQLFIAFLLLFFLITQGTHKTKKYFQTLGFEYKNVWYLTYESTNNGLSREVRLNIYNNIHRTIASMKGLTISSVSLGAAPFAKRSGYTTTISLITKESVGYENFVVDSSFKSVLNLKIAEGRWFNEYDHQKDRKPIVITPALKEAYFGNNKAVGEEFSKRYEVIGVLENYRKSGEFGDETAVFFELMKPESKFFTLLKVPENSGIELEEQLARAIHSIAPGWQVKIIPLSEKRAELIRKELTPLMVIGGIGIFLFINVLLGLFGVLWYSISQRTSEIGLRRAIGATSKNVSIQFVSEMLVLASMGIIPGIVVAIQIQVFNLLETSNDIYILAIVLTSLLIYSLVSLCALIPGMKSTKIHPAQALSEE